MKKDIYYEGMISVGMDISFPKGKYESIEGYNIDLTKWENFSNKVPSFLVVGENNFRNGDEVDNLYRLTTEYYFDNKWNRSMCGSEGEIVKWVKGGEKHRVIAVPKEKSTISKDNTIIKTVLQELKGVLEREIEFVGGLYDTKEDKTVASYLRTVIAEIDNRYMEQEKQQIADAYDRGWDAHYNKNYAHTGINYYLKTFNKEV